MRLRTALEAVVPAECWNMARDFVREIAAEWKAWLTGSAPMATLGILTLVIPDAVRLPAWSWSVLVFVAGLIAATFRVYRDLRRRHDTLRAQLASAGISGPFVLVPFASQQESAHDL